MGELEIAVSNDRTVFENLASFSVEVANPLVLKRELDRLIAKLGRANAVHANRVVTRVLGKDKTRGVVDMQVMIPLRHPDAAESFFAANDRYTLVPEYSIGPSYRISIPNDQALFRQAAEKFLQMGSGTGLAQFDATRQHIIEVSRIDLYGNVLGFDLYMEIEPTEEAPACSQ
jgi:hypothetical protein